MSHAVLWCRRRATVESLPHADMRKLSGRAAQPTETPVGRHSTPWLVARPHGYRRRVFA
jgi:hypothetical protein